MSPQPGSTSQCGVQRLHEWCALLYHAGLLPWGLPHVATLHAKTPLGSQRLIIYTGTAHVIPTEVTVLHVRATSSDRQRHVLHCRQTTCVWCSGGKLNHCRVDVY